MVKTCEPLRFAFSLCRRLRWALAPSVPSVPSVHVAEVWLGEYREERWKQFHPVLSGGTGGIGSGRRGVWWPGSPGGPSHAEWNRVAADHPLCTAEGWAEGGLYFYIFYILLYTFIYFCTLYIFIYFSICDSVVFASLLYRFDLFCIRCPNMSKSHSASSFEVTSLAMAIWHDILEVKSAPRPIQGHKGHGLYKDSPP